MEVPIFPDNSYLLRWALNPWIYFTYQHSGPKAVRHLFYTLKQNIRYNCIVLPRSYHYPKISDLWYNKFRHSTLTTVLLFQIYLLNYFTAVFWLPSSEIFGLLPITLLASTHWCPLVLSLLNILYQHAANAFLAKFNSRWIQQTCIGTMPRSLGAAKEINRFVDPSRAVNTA